jgi:hypothetical protein
MRISCALFDKRLCCRAGDAIGNPPRGGFEGCEWVVGGVGFEFEFDYCFTPTDIEAYEVRLVTLY